MTSKLIVNFEKYLERFMNFERLPDSRMLKLTTMSRLADLAGHPELACRAIHVAGSKGKGSTACMIASILKAAGYQVGVYGSPHLVDFRERVTNADGFFSDEIYADAIAELQNLVEKCQKIDPETAKYLTWFELVTMFGFLVFRRANCDFAVYEVGMGGRLDATNIIQPEICCITNIELEHTEYLGDTIAAIAGEKAGIIKPGVPVIIGQRHPESAPVFTKIAQAQNAPLHFATPLGNCQLKMPGKVQLENAALAVAACKTILPNLSDNIIRQGLSTAALPGRFEIIQNPFAPHLPVVLDAAHTVNSVASTLATFDELYPSAKANLLFALARGKDYDGIVSLLEGRFEQIFLTKPGDFKKSDLPELTAVFAQHHLEVTASPDYAQLIKQALRASAEAESPLLITGSFYLLAEVRQIL